MYMYAYIHIYIHMYVYVYICMYMYIYVNEKYICMRLDLRSIFGRRCLLLPSDDIYSTTNQSSYYVFYIYVYMFQGSAPVEVASVIYRGKLN